MNSKLEKIKNKLGSRVDFNELQELIKATNKKLDDLIASNNKMKETYITNQIQTTQEYQFVYHFMK